MINIHTPERLPEESREDYRRRREASKRIASMARAIRPEPMNPTPIATAVRESSPGGLYAADWIGPAYPVPVSGSMVKPNKGRNR